MDIEVRKKISEVVKKARHSMSQRSFAKLIGVSYTTVQFWEKGESIPDIEKLAEIAARAGYRIDELFEYLGIKPTSEKTSDFAVMIRQINKMPISQVAEIVEFGFYRLKKAALESTENKAKVS